MSYCRDCVKMDGYAEILFSRYPVLLVCLLVLIPTLTYAAPGRFFIMGDGTIHIRNAKTEKDAQVHLFNADGSINEEGFTKIDAVFGFPTREKGEHISPRLICMLDYFSDLVAPGKVINLDSGYRNPEYNARIRNAGGNVAKTSQHIDGMALDFNIDGVNGKELWEIIKNKECCGVGYYGGTDIHLDSARPRFWEAATSKVGTGESDYNRRIYLSTDFDRYRPGDRVRLSLSSVSDFSFGVNRTVALVGDASGPVVTAEITTGNNADCVMIESRKASRLIYVNLPATLPTGRYKVRMGFCNRPFPQMPADTLSNEIEVLSGPDSRKSLPSPVLKKSY
jgi:uncharacterized protein YcbK (DUF882 family)